MILLECVKVTDAILLAYEPQVIVSLYSYRDVIKKMYSNLARIECLSLVGLCRSPQNHERSQCADSARSQLQNVRLLSGSRV